MSEDRPVEDLTAVVARLQTELNDLRTTLTARTARRPTGDVESTIRSTAKAETLMLQGQTVARATYPVLWQWVQDQGLVTAGFFTAGDGTTTFALPDFRARVLVGAYASFPLGSLWGAGTTTLTAANMPVHDHNISGSISGVGDHDHATTGSGGLHGGHVSEANVNHAVGTGGAHGHPPSWGYDLGNHGHPMNWDGSHSHGHTLNIATAGNASPTAVNTQPPSVAVNWLIWV